MIVYNHLFILGKYYAFIKSRRFMCGAGNSNSKLIIIKYEEDNDGLVVGGPVWGLGCVGWYLYPDEIQYG